MSRPEPRRVHTSVLEVAYEAWGPQDGPPVLLLHGFPDDARSWSAVGERLAAAGHYAVAPYLRGFGPTRFLNDDTPKAGGFAALASDALEFADALGLGRFALAGHDWGASAAQSLAALRPQRMERLVSFAGYAVAWSVGGGPPPYEALERLWYQYLLNLDEGEGLLRADRHGFCRHLWRRWSPTWPGREAAYDSVAGSLENPDFVDVVLSAYRSGRRETASDPRYDEDEARLAAGPAVPVPTVVLLGADDGLEPGRPETPPEDRLFTGGYTRRVLDGVGHFPHRERPEAVADAILSPA